MRLAFTNTDKILTSPVYETGSAKNLKPRIADTVDVVTKITMANPAQENGECWLSEQALFNPRCKLKDTEILDDIVSHDLKYNEVVNMQDVTGLDHVQFSDVFDLGQAKPSKAKRVNFLEKFPDPETISESKVLEKKNLRTRN